MSTKVLALCRNVAANSVTTLLVTIFQVLSVPVFLRFWGVQLYGEWIALNTLTAYFQISDVGLNTATANSLTFAYAAGDHRRCNVLLNNNIAFISGAFGLVLLALLPAVELGVFVRLFRFRLLTASVMNACLLLLFAQVFVGTLTNLLSGIYRATGTFARGVMIDNAIRAAEYSAMLGGVALKWPLPVVVSLGLGVKLVGFTGKLIDSRRYFRFDLSTRYLSLLELRKMWVPAVSFFLFPVSNSIALQAPITLINFFLGGAAVVVFNTTRTLINFARALVDVLQRSVWPELSIAYGNGDFALMRRLHRHSLVVATTVVLMVSAGLALFGPRIYMVWTRHDVHLDTTLYSLFLVSLVTGALWSTSGIVLQATNKHNRLSVVYFLSALVTLAGSFVILRLTARVSLLPLAIIASDLIMIAFVVKRSLILTRDSFAEFRSSYGRDLRTRMFASR